MNWRSNDRIDRDDHEERREFQDALETATRIIAGDPDEELFFIQSARVILAGVLHGLHQSNARRVSVSELVQTVESFERIVRALHATAEGLKIHKRYFYGPSDVLMNVLLVLEDRVLRLLEPNNHGSR